MAGESIPLRVIGVEIRVGAQSPRMNRSSIEVQLVPLAIDFPTLLSDTENNGNGPMQPRMDFTIHTSRGDVNCQVNLPVGYSRENIPGSDSMDALDAAYQQLARNALAK